MLMLVPMRVPISDLCQPTNQPPLTVDPTGGAIDDLPEIVEQQHQEPLFGIHQNQYRW
jgi:hypothetical protein